MVDVPFADALGAFCRKNFDGADIQDLRQLSGGASMESWLFTCGGRDMVLRRLPDGITDLEAASSITAISLDAQADLIELARMKGVTAPQVLATLEPSDGVGQGFVMAKAEGETLPHKILGKAEFAEAEANLTQNCAAELAAIHSVDADGLPAEIRAISAADLLGEQENFYRSMDANIPVFDYALGWLNRNLPEPTTPRLVHGDFRMGNLMIDSQGINAVLDWELAHLGDPMEDVAYLCTPSWRFGRYEKEAGGFDSADNFIAAYEGKSGNTVDRSSFNWWLIYNTFWWGLACLRMGNAYRDGSVPTLERTVIGRRASEVEIDLLLQFEAMQPDSASLLSFAELPLLPESGEVAYAEITKALMEWNKSKNMPEAKGHALFEARVANNALGILQRDAAWGESFSLAQSERRAALGMTQQMLCEKLRSGETDLSGDAVWDHLRLTALERVSIDQPKYAGLAAARSRWT